MSAILCMQYSAVTAAIAWHWHSEVCQESGTTIQVQQPLTAAAAN